MGYRPTDGRNACVLTSLDIDASGLALPIIVADPDSEYCVAITTLRSNLMREFRPSGFILHLDY